MKHIARMEFAEAMIDALNGGQVMNERVLTYNPETGEFWSGSSLTPLGDGEFTIVDDVHAIIETAGAELPDAADFLNGFEELWEDVKFRAEHDGLDVDEWSEWADDED